MQITYEFFSNIGSRNVNEDCFKVAENDNGFCFVVCDGLGGHSGGDVASSLVAESICDSFNSNGDDEKFFELAFEKAQRDLLSEQIKLNDKYGMKTTAVALKISGNTFQYAHIGDSRLYHIRKNKVHKRTIDHSVPQMLALTGEIKEKEIRHHPDRNRLLRVAGIEWTSSKYDVSDKIELNENDAFLLCTDGFWESITEKEICKTRKKAKSANEWLNIMAEIVHKNGSCENMDNNSAIAIICER